MVTTLINILDDGVLDVILNILPISSCAAFACVNRHVRSVDVLARIGKRLSCSFAATPTLRVSIRLVLVDGARWWQMAMTHTTTKRETTVLTCNLGRLGYNEKIRRECEFEAALTVDACRDPAGSNSIFAVSNLEFFRVVDLLHKAFQDWSYLPAATLCCDGKTYISGKAALVGICPKTWVQEGALSGPAPHVLCRGRRTSVCVFVRLEASSLQRNYRSRFRAFFDDVEIPAYFVRTMLSFHVCEGRSPGSDDNEMDLLPDASRHLARTALATSFTRKHAD